MLVFFLEKVPAFSYHLLALFTLCYVGQNVTNGFEDVGEMVYQLNWYHFPMHIQKDMPTILAVSHKKVRVEVFGSVRCNFPTFKAV